MEKTFAKLGSLIADLDAAWQDRLADADELFRAGRNAWAIATALYALEIRLKVMICRRLDVQQLPRAFEVHDLDGLLLLAGLSRRILRRSARKVKENWNAMVTQSQELNDIRYSPDNMWTHDQAATFLSRLKDPPNGVLPWLSKQR